MAAESQNNSLTKSPRLLLSSTGTDCKDMHMRSPTQPHVMHSNRVAAGTEAKQQLCMLHTASLAVTKSSYHLARKVRCIHAH